MITKLLLLICLSLCESGKLSGVQSKQIPVKSKRTLVFSQAVSIPGRMCSSVQLYRHLISAVFLAFYTTQSAL